MFSQCHLVRRVGDGLTSVLVVSPDVLDAPEPGVVVSLVEARCRRTLLASLSVVVRSLEQTRDMCLCFDTSFLCSHPCTKEQTEREREGERDYDSQGVLCGFDSLRDDRENELQKVATDGQIDPKKLEFFFSYCLVLSKTSLRSFSLCMLLIQS